MTKSPGCIAAIRADARARGGTGGRLRAGLCRSDMRLCARPFRPTILRFPITGRALLFYPRMRAFILAAIGIYQRHLSSRKGYCCAYRTHTGRKSCSVLGFRAVRRYGTILGLLVLRRRLYLCGVAYRRYADLPSRPRPPRGQRGDCDPGCDAPCDGPDASCDWSHGKKCFRAADFCECLDCDFPRRERRNKGEEQYIHIPPRQ